MRFGAVVTRGGGLTPFAISAFVGLAACGDVQPAGAGRLDSSGSETEDVSTEFVLTVVNETGANQFVTIFQDHFETGAQNVIPLAWKAIEIAPGAQAEFQWTENYSFNWSSAGLTEGGTYVVSESVAAGTAIDNEITLSDASGTTGFDGLSEGPMSNELTIHVESEEASFVGVGLAGTPIFAAEALMNDTQVFDALDPDYTISSGTKYNVGQAVDPGVVDAFNSFSSADGSRLVATLSDSAGELVWTIERD